MTDEICSNCGHPKFMHSSFNQEAYRIEEGKYYHCYAGHDNCKCKKFTPKSNHSEESPRVEKLDEMPDYETTNGVCDGVTVSQQQQKLSAHPHSSQKSNQSQLPTGKSEIGINTNSPADTISSLIKEKEKEKENIKDVEDFVQGLRDDFIDRVKIAYKENCTAFFDNKEEAIDWIDDVIVHSKIIAKREAELNLLLKIKGMIENCWIERKMTTDKIMFMMDFKKELLGEDEKWDL